MSIETTAPLNLRQKMLEVMRSIGHIEKRGEHPKFHYAFAQASDVFLAVREAFLAQGVVFLSSEEGKVMLPEQAESQSGNAIFRVFLQMRFTLLDTESDEKLEALHTGEAMDNQDKGANKAKTAALKGFLLQTFLIPTGDDTEAEDHEAKPTQNARRVEGQACPKCGMVGAIIKGKPEYGGGWLCFGKKGGCGAKFDTDQATETPRQGTEPPPPQYGIHPATITDPATETPHPLDLQSGNGLASESHRKTLWKACVAKMGKGQATYWMEGQLRELGRTKETLTVDNFKMLFEAVAMWKPPTKDGTLPYQENAEAMSDRDIEW
jgi:hypothetical protein